MRKQVSLFTTNNPCVRRPLHRYLRSLKKTNPRFSNTPHTTRLFMSALSPAYLLASGASHSALAGAVLAARPNPEGLHALSLLARIGLWLRLLWGAGERAGKSEIIQSEAIIYAAPPAPSRAQQRRARHRNTRGRAKLSRQGCELAPLIYRVSGRARYERFLYDMGADCRVKWCFSDWNWRWPSRLCFCAADIFCAPRDAAPLTLFPD